MSCSTVGKLRGNVTSKEIIKILEANFKMECRDFVKKESHRIPENLTIFNNYTNSETWDETKGFIVCNLPDGNSATLYYYKSNLNFHENFDYYAESQPQNIKMVTSETTYVSFLACAFGEKLVKTLINEFGGWYSANDCRYDFVEITGRRDKELAFNLKKRENALNCRLDVLMDIKATGTKKETPILQISAVKFNICTGEIFDTFTKTIDISKINTVEGRTIVLYLGAHGHSLINTIQKNQKSKLSEKELLETFIQWITTNPKPIPLNKVSFWQNSPTHLQLKDKCESYDIKYPFTAENEKSIATVFELANIKACMNSHQSQYNDDNSEPQMENSIKMLRFKAKLLAKTFSFILKEEK